MNLLHIIHAYQPSTGGAQWLVQRPGFFTERAADQQPEVRFPAMFDGHHLANLNSAPKLGQDNASRFFARNP